MAQEVICSILLACRSGRSNKEYLIEVLEDFDQNTAKQMIARYGPSGRLGGLKEYGSYSSNDANKLIESKLKKGEGQCASFGGADASGLWPSLGGCVGHCDVG